MSQSFENLTTELCEIYTGHSVKGRHFKTELNRSLKQSNFERNAKKILGFEHFSLQIRDIEKNCLLIVI